MNINRRTFIEQGTAVALMTAAVGLTSNCSRSHPQADFPATDDKLLRMLGPELSDVLDLAARAPSGHNTQPWTVRVLDRMNWVLGVANARRLPAVDPAGRETLLSIGAFVENLCVGAQHYGFAVDTDVSSADSKSPFSIALRLRQVSPSGLSLESIKLRRTVRKGYLDRPLAPADLASIRQYGEGLTYLPKSSLGAAYLASETIAANRQQASRDDAEAELGDWIRWSKADAARHNNGLTPDSMEIGGPANWYVSHFYNRTTVLSQSFRNTSVDQVRQRVKEGAGWLVISSRDGAASTLIETGRRVENLWLQLREKKLAIHPMTQMLEEAPWRGQVAAKLGIEGVPQFILRIGYLDIYPEPSSLRMPVPSFIVGDIG